MQIKLDGPAIEAALQKLVDEYPDLCPSIACNIEKNGQIEYRAGTYRLDGGWDSEFEADPIGAADKLIRLHPLDKSKQARIAWLQAELAKLQKAAA